MKGSVGLRAAWRANVLLHEARMIKRLTRRSDGEQRRAGWGVGARREQAGRGQVRRVLRVVSGGRLRGRGGGRLSGRGVESSRVRQGV